MSLRGSDDIAQRGLIKLTRQRADCFAAGVFGNKEGVPVPGRRTKFVSCQSQTNRMIPVEADNAARSPTGSESLRNGCLICVWYVQFLNGDNF